MSKKKKKNTAEAVDLREQVAVLGEAVQLLAEEVRQLRGLVHDGVADLDGRVDALGDRVDYVEEWECRLDDVESTVEGLDLDHLTSRVADVEASCEDLDTRVDFAFAMLREVRGEVVALEVTR